MRKSVILLATSLVLAACGKQDAETKPEAEADKAAAAPAAVAPLAAMPERGVSGEAAKKVMYDRHEAFEDMGDQMKLLTREAKADAPDMAAVKGALDKLAAYSSQLPGWFPKGTGPNAGKTEALAVIWETPDDFYAKAKAFHEKANAMAAVSDGAAFKAGFAELGGTCKACHDKYREKE